MKNFIEELESHRERFLRDATPVRLGNLASTLGHIAVLIPQPPHTRAVKKMIDEAAWFVEWAVPDLSDVEEQAELVDLQRQLSRWRNHWEAVSADESSRLEIAQLASRWKARVLEMSGLLEREPTRS